MPWTMPRVANFAALPTAGVTDRIILCLDTGRFWRDTGSTWVEIAPGGGGGAHPDLATHDTLGLATQTELDAHTHANDHARLHSIIGVSDHNGFPGGTTTFLRADGAFAAPPGGGGGMNLLKCFFSFLKDKRQDNLRQPFCLIRTKDKDNPFI